MKKSRSLRRLTPLISIPVLSLSFDDRDFISHANDCFEQYSQLKKKELYKRLVNLQNSDLYKKSKNLKIKKDETS